MQLDRSALKVRRFLSTTEPLLRGLSLGKFTLDLCEKLHPTVAASLIDILCAQPGLLELNIVAAYHFPQIVASLPTILAQCPLIATLTIFSPERYDQPWPNVMQVLPTLANLQCLHLSNCFLTDGHLLALCEVLPQCQRLEDLSVALNPVGLYAGNAISTIVVFNQALAACLALRTLDVSNIYYFRPSFDSEPILSLPVAPKLTVVHIGWTRSWMKDLRYIQQEVRTWPLNGQCELKIVYASLNNDEMDAVHDIRAFLARQRTAARFLTMVAASSRRFPTSERPPIELWGEISSYLFFKKKGIK